MSDVLEIRELSFDGPNLLVVEAVVDQMVLTHQGNQYDPPEWGAALCRGTMQLHPEDLMPSTDKELQQMISDRIIDWAPIDWSDCTDE